MMMLLVSLFFYQLVAPTTAFVPSWKATSPKLKSFLKSSTSDNFIRLAKEYIADPSPDRLGENFVFRGPVVGPLGKKVGSKLMKENILGHYRNMIH